MKKMKIRSLKVEIPMKQFRVEEAKRIGISPASLANDWSRGRRPYPKVRRVNKRVVFVIIET